MSDEINMVGESLNTLSDKLNTALEALQQSNTALQEQLDKANEIEYMRKSFISAVSHELKTPLAIIQGYAEALENLQNVSAETREYYCFVIRSETRKMDGLVKDILNLSRLEAGRLHLELTNFDFVALIEETKIRFQAPAEEKKIRIVWNMLAEMPAYGDPGRYDIILNNFLSNAVDYTPVNGTIRITAKAEEDDYLIEVFNEGKQIPEEYHQRIWEPFTRSIHHIRAMQSVCSAATVSVWELFRPCLRCTARSTVYAMKKTALPYGSPSPEQNKTFKMLFFPAGDGSIFLMLNDLLNSRLYEE